MSCARHVKRRHEFLQFCTTNVKMNLSMLFACMAYIVKMRNTVFLQVCVQLFFFNLLKSVTNSDVTAQIVNVTLTSQSQTWILIKKLLHHAYRQSMSVSQYFVEKSRNYYSHGCPDWVIFAVQPLHPIIWNTCWIFTRWVAVARLHVACRSTVPQQLMGAETRERIGEKGDALAPRNWKKNRHHMLLCYEITYLCFISLKLV